MNSPHLILALGFLLIFGCAGQAAQESKAQADNDFPDMVWIPLSEVTETVKHFEHDTGGVTVRYFAVRGSDGAVRTAFDACEVCYRSRKGYTQVGNDVRCNNCGLSFNIDDLGTENQGKGCWPAYLSNEVRDGKVFIKNSDLEGGSYLFS